MVSDTPSSGLAHFLHGLSSKTKLFLFSIILVLVLAIASLLVAYILSGRGFELSSLKVPPFETAQERACKAAMQTAENNEKAVKARIENLEAQIASVGQRIYEVRGACLSEVSSRPGASQTGCTLIARSSRMLAYDRDAVVVPSGASGYYLQVIADMMQEREALKQRVIPLEDQQKQRHEEWLRISERCSGFTLPR